MTGHREHPRLQQQQRQPQTSHLTFTGSVFFSTLLMRASVARNSSGATRDTSPGGNSVLNLLLRPNLKRVTRGLFQFSAEMARPLLTRSCCPRPGWLSDPERRASYRPGWRWSRPAHPPPGRSHQSPQTFRPLGGCVLWVMRGTTPVLI